MLENLKNSFKQYNFALSLFPIITYFLYINYSLIRNPYTGLFDYFYSFIGIPLTLFLSLIIYLISLIFNSNDATDLLLCYVAISILVLIYKIIYYNDIKIGGKKININGIKIKKIQK